MIGTFVAGNFFVASDRSVGSSSLGIDFLAFYSAGTFARTGQYNQLYNLDSIRAAEQSIAAANHVELGSGFGPYWNPPFYAWVFAPLSAMPYRWALMTWTIVSVICLGIAITMLMRMLPASISEPPAMGGYIEDPIPLRFHRDWRDTALVPLLILVSMPFIQAISHGQNTLISLMLLTLVVTAWRKQHAILAGALCGLMFYKPQLAAVLAVMLVLTLGIRVIVGLGAVGVVFSLITVFTMPGSLENYLTQLPGILRYMQVDHAYAWERHVTLRAFWRLLLQGRGAGEATSMVTMLTLASGGLIGLGLLGAWWRSRKPGMDDCWTGETQSVARDRLSIATICAMPLLMPFYFDYDLLLLAVPAVLLAAEMSSRSPGVGIDRVERVLVGSWIALFAWLMINPPIAGASGVNVSVVLLNLVCWLSIVRAMRRGVRTETLVLPMSQRVVAYRAAA